MAYLAHPASWRQKSEDQRYILVMVSPLPVDEDAGHPSYDGNEIRQIRAKYSKSGLYRNDGSTKPLWTIQYFSRPRQAEVYIAPDGEHLIFGADEWFVGWFFARGRSLAVYTVDDLVSYCRVKSLLSLRLTSCVWSHFDADSLTYTIRTNQGEEFTFDVTTGQVIRTQSPWPLCFAATFVGIIVALGFAMVFVLRRRRQKAAQDEGVNIRRQV